MPRYDYECDVCQHQFELKQSFDSDRVSACPRCEGSAHRKFHVVPVVFKGSGWYVNDYGKRGTAMGTGSEAKEAADAGDKAPVKVKADADAKAEAKSEPKGESAAKSESKSKPESKPSSKAKVEPKAETASAKAPARTKDD